MIDEYTRKIELKQMDKDELIELVLNLEATIDDWRKDSDE